MRSCLPQEAHDHLQRHAKMKVTISYYLMLNILTNSLVAVLVIAFDSTISNYK